MNQQEKFQEENKEIKLKWPRWQAKCEKWYQTNVKIENWFAQKNKIKKEL
jgi:hypothetical protein